MDQSHHEPRPDQDPACVVATNRCKHSEQQESSELDEEGGAQTVSVLIPGRSGPDLQERHLSGETRPVTVPFGYVHHTTIDGCRTADDLALVAALALHTGSGMRVPYESLDWWPEILGLSARRTYSSLDRLEEAGVISMGQGGLYISTSKAALEERDAGRGTTRYALVTGPTLAAAALSAQAARTAPARNAAVLIALLAYRNGLTGCSIIGASRLRDDTGLGSSAVWTALDELEQAGLVEREARYRRVRDERGRAHVYRSASVYLTHPIYTAEQADLAELGSLADRRFSQVAEAAAHVRAERLRRRAQPG